MRFKYLVIVLLAMFPAACGDDEQQSGDVNCAEETRGDQYVAGLEKVGAQNGIKVVLVESTPAPPARGENTWRLRVLDEVDTPLDGLTLTVTPFMPDHGHGTVVQTEVTALPEAGEYQATPVHLQMPGYWEVTIEVDDGAGLTDQVVMGFCIEG